MRSILVINAGSSTIKFSVFKINSAPNHIQKIYVGLIDKVTTAPSIKIKAIQEQDGKHQAVTILEEALTSGALNSATQQLHAGDPYAHAIHTILSWLEQHDLRVVAAGHRVAHGGTRCKQAVPFDAEVMSYLESLSPLAPLHQPYNLKGCKIIQEKFPNILQVACFDTSFHTTCNKLSQLFALPQKYIAAGVHRYGFHGLSYEYIVSQFDKYLPQDKVNGKIIIAHLGQGASMCAVDRKQSVATTLSFSALDGLPMGTRCGNIDPGVLLHFMTHYKMDAQQIENLLYRESGLLGVSGVSSDMRVLLESDHPHARLAVDLFAYKTSAWIGTLAAELQGLDGLVFTAGIGENAAAVRAKICERTAWLGVRIDQDKNGHNATTISSPESQVTVHVIPTDEELMIAEDTFGYLHV